VKATLSWIVGRGGLLGGHVETSLLARDARAAVWRPEKPIPWYEGERAAADLRREAEAFFRQAARSGRPWRLVWCAGAGVVATSPDALAAETLLLSRLLAGVAEQLLNDAHLARAGTLFFSSSAGGVHAAAAARPPFDEDSPVGALAPYGREKLAQEELFRRVADACEVDLLIGRFSNLYGPGQNLMKPQGLVAHVGRAALRREPVSIYVPLDTIRDYLFAADAGRMVVDAIERRSEARQAGASPASITKIFASEMETTVASVLTAWRQALRRPLRVALASNPMSHLQPRVLSFRSRIWPELRGQPTLLSIGIDAVRRDQLARWMAGGQLSGDSAPSGYSSRSDRRVDWQPLG
jgi:UDP-glucose 4-epimerase